MANELIGLEAILSVNNFTKGQKTYTSGLFSIEKTTLSTAKSINSNLNTTGTSMTSVGKIAGTVLVAGFAAAAAAAVGLVTGLAFVSSKGIGAAISFESAFAGVIKTTDGLADSTGKLTEDGALLAQGFRDLSKIIPIDVETLANIGELGGQLGIQKENLLDFSETIAAISVSTNLVTEEAALGFAKFANILGTPQSKIENIGSSIVGLGNNFATTERDILSFGLRIAGAGQIVGLTEGSILGIGTAMSSVGVEAEAGGSAVQKVLLNINEAVLTSSSKLDTFAETSGLSASEFSKLWKEDAGQAFTLFVEGLGKSGDNAALILAELDLKDQRLIRSFLSLSNAGDLLRDTMTTGNEAFIENTALAAEAEARYRTTESQLTLLDNIMNDIGISIGNALLPAFNSLISKFSQFLTENESVLIPFFEKLGKFLEVNIPIAAEAAANAFNTTLVPAFTTFSDYVRTNIFPLMGELGWLMFDVIIPKIKALKESWDNDLVPAFKRVQSFIDNTLRPSLTHLSNVFDSVLGPSFDALVDTIKQYLLPGFDNLNNSVGTNITKAVDIVEQNWPKIEKFIKDTMFFIRDDVIPTFFELKDWFDTNWPIMKAVVLTTWEVIESVITTVIGVITEKIVPRLTKIMTDIQNTMDEVGIDWGDVWESIKKAITIAGGIIGVISLVIIDTVLSLVSSFTEAFGNITEGISDLSKLFTRQSDNIKEIFGNLSLFIGNLFSGNFDEAFENAKTIFTAWVDSITTNLEIIETLFDISFGTVLKFVGTFIEDFVGFFIDLADDLVGHSVIPDMMSDIITSISSGFGDIISDTANFLSDMLNKFLSFDGLSVGRDMLDGVTQGIRDKSADMIRAVSSAAHSAINTFKDILDINSPSGVGKILGKAIPEGGAIGVEEGTPLLNNATKRMGESAIAGAEQGLSSSIVNNFVSPNNTATNTTLPQQSNLSNSNNIESLLSQLIGVIGNQESNNTTINQTNNVQPNSNIDIAQFTNLLKQSLGGIN